MNVPDKCQNESMGPTATQICASVDENVNCAGGYQGEAIEQLEKSNNEMPHATQTAFETLVNVCADDQNSMPCSWVLHNTTCLDFEKKERVWDTAVANNCDLAIMPLKHEVEDDKEVMRYIPHMSHALNRPEVGHVYCTTSQFGRFESAAKKAGLYVARDAALYIYHPQNTKGLTLGGQCQPINECGAIFWKDSPGSKDKHYFNKDVIFPFSEESSWVNVVSGIRPAEKLYDENREKFDIAEMPNDFTATILRRWCKPGGKVYDATAGYLGVGISPTELGMTFVAAEQNQGVFEAGKQRLHKLFCNDNAKTTNRSAAPCCSGTTICQLQSFCQSKTN